MNPPWNTFQTTIQNILNELSFIFLKKDLTLITSSSFKQRELKRKTEAPHVLSTKHQSLSSLLWKSTLEVLLLQDTSSSFKAAGNSIANQTLSSQVQVCRESHWLSSSANFYTTLHCKNSFSTAPTEIAQRSLKKMLPGKGERDRKQRNITLIVLFF